jgi:uncharacterized protein (TIGR02246 family)
MKQMLIGAAVALVVSSAIGSSRAATGDEDVIRQAKDRAQIEALMWRYTRALDTADAETYASVYTTDGQFRGGANATKGREALKKMVADMKDRQKAAEAKGESRPPMYHMTMNSHLTFVDKDHARIEAYWQTVFGAAGQSTPPRVAAAGRSIDQLVRVNGQWLIQSRDVAPRE